MTTGAVGPDVSSGSSAAGDGVRVAVLGSRTGALSATVVSPGCVRIDPHQKQIGDEGADDGHHPSKQHDRPGEEHVLGDQGAQQQRTDRRQPEHERDDDATGDDEGQRVAVLANGLSATRTGYFMIAPSLGDSLGARGTIRLAARRGDWRA